MQRFEILFKFVYTGQYLTENIGTSGYLAVQIGTGRYLTGIITDINVYRFLAGTVRYGRYGIYNYDFVASYLQISNFNRSKKNRVVLSFAIFLLIKILIGNIFLAN